MGYPRIEGLGRIDSPLEVVQINGDVRLVVTPVGAIGTDALLLGTGAALFFAVKPPVLRIAGAVGAAWALLAIGVEVAKLIRGPQQRYRELVEV